MQKTNNELIINGENEFTLKKSNSLLSAKFKTSSFAYDALNYAMVRVQKNYSRCSSNLETVLYATDLNRLVNKGKNIYREIAKLSAALLSHVMIIENENGFEMFNVITNINYFNDSKSLHIIFNNSLKDHLIELTSNYRIEDIAITSMLRSYSTKKIYELIIVDTYKLAYKTSILQEYRISEFKFLIGIADMDCEKVKSYLSQCKAKNRPIDWDYAYNELCDDTDKVYDEWSEFRRRILIPAQKEIKEKADYAFDFEPIREGHEYKRIKIIVFKNTPDEKWVKEKQSLDEDLKKDVENECALERLLDEYVGHNNLTEQSIRTFFKVAKADAEEVRSAISLADKQKNIENYAGWIVDAIKNGRATPIEVIDGSAQKADSINSIKDSFNKDKSDTAKSVWEKYKKRDDMQTFLDSQDMTMEEYENAFDYEKRVARYLKWKTKK